MTLDPRTLGAAFVLLSAALSVLLLFAWILNRKVRALAWWASTFFLVPAGVGLAVLGQRSLDAEILFLANALVIMGYGALYAGCRTFNGRSRTAAASIVGLAVWACAFPFIQDMPNDRLILLSMLAGAYAGLSAWELWFHAPLRLVSQRMAVIFLVLLAAFNFGRGLLGVSLTSIFWIDALANRWSAEMALLLVIYAPMLAFIFLAMAKERVEREHRDAALALRESEEHYRYSVELNPQLPWTADPQGNILHTSSRWNDLTGILVDGALGTGWLQAVHPDDLGPTRERWSQGLSSGEPVDAEYRLRMVDGSYRWFRARAAARRNADGIIIRWYGTVEDIHDRRVAQDGLRWAAHHDSLTGLPNRRLFQERLRQALDRAAGLQRKVGLLLLDLDDFKQINDRFGHDAGDTALKAFAQGLQGIVPGRDLVARLGGDEFAVIIPVVETEADVANTAKAVLGRMSGFEDGNRISHEFRTSIGGAISTGIEMEPDELLKQADIALYRGKAAGPGMFRMFEPVMREEMQQSASALRLARRALEADWIVPYYQPKVEMGTGRLAGFEALLRWRHPRLGIQSPQQIAPAFEDVTLGTVIGERMLSSILRDLCAWREAGIEIGSIAVNASESEFLRGDYAERVLGQLRAAGVPASCLELEVTESVFLGRDAKDVEHALKTLSAEGVRIALDDFGTGYASLSHLKRFPVDVIKLDRSFVGNLEEDLGNAAIVKTVLNLGQSLGISVVAEGVETLAQALFLREQGCDLGQGYFFERPIPADAVPRLIRTWRQDAVWQHGEQASRLGGRI